MTRIINKINTLQKDISKLYINNAAFILNVLSVAIFTSYKLEIFIRKRHYCLYGFHLNFRFFKEFHGKKNEDDEVWDILEMTKTINEEGSVIGHRSRDLGLGVGWGFREDKKEDTLSLFMFPILTSTTQFSFAS